MHAPWPFVAPFSQSWSSMSFPGLLAALSLALPDPSINPRTDAVFSREAGENGEVVDRSAPPPAESTSAEQIAPRVAVKIVGAKVLPLEVYLDVLRLPDSARATAATAA